MMRKLCILILLSCTAVAQADLVSEGFEIRYAVSRSGLPMGQSVRTLRPLGPDQWLFSARTVPTGIAAVLFNDVIDEQSHLQLIDGLVVPIDYRYKQHGGRKEKAYSLHFDWTTRQLHFLHSSEQLPLPTGAQDPLGFVVAVMQKLSQGEQDFQLTIAGHNKLRSYQVKATEQVDMETVLGRQAVVHVKAQEIGKDTHYDLWCLRDRDYLPLRIRQMRKDAVTDLRLRELITPPPVIDAAH